MNIIDRDRALIWHPFTQEQTADPPICITHGKGAYLYDINNKRYLDLVSSWWVNLHGHTHPTIAAAIHQQAMKLEHVMFAGFTHQPAVELCEQLKTILPTELSKFFFSDNGSTAVEIALKMAYQFWWNQGEQQRSIFLSFEGAYHGDTFGAMSVGKSSGFYEPFEQFMFEVATIAFPATWNNDVNMVQKEAQALESLTKYLAVNSHKIIAFIAEPLIQGAGGMRLCRPIFLQQVIDLLRQHGILIIFDEVMTGFGRTGTNFALEQVARTPDILCLSKGLTGGFLPLALTIVQQKIYTTFLSEHFSKAFVHGHSYTANPLGCAAAIASLNLLLTNETQNKIKIIAQVHQECLANLAKRLDIIVAPRQIGTIAAFNIQDERTSYSNPICSKLKKLFLQRGLLLRPLGNTVYLLPPYCISVKDLAEAYSDIEKILLQNSD